MLLLRSESDSVDGELDRYAHGVKHDDGQSTA